MTVSLFLALSVRAICPRLCTGTTIRTIRTIRTRTRRKRPHDPRRAFNPHAERFQADKTELYEEPTIAEMEAAIAKEQNELRETGEEPSEDGSFDFEPMDDADLALALENKPTTTTGKNKGAEKKKKKGDRPRAKRKPADSKPAAARKNRRGNP